MRNRLTKILRLRSMVARLRSALADIFPAWRGALRFPPGHSYSPLLDCGHVSRRSEEFLDRQGQLWQGIDLRPEAQLSLLTEFLETVELQLMPHPSSISRYHSDNVYFHFFDAFVVEAMVHKFAPRKIVEVGSGFSSAQLLDACERRQLSTRFTFVDPDPERLLSLLRPDDLKRCDLISAPVQSVSSDVFTALAADDLLFIDSSHVLKVGSDVSDILFRILPSLKPGVIIHFHDIFYPEAYPLEWLRDGRAWNESLAVRLLLQNREGYEIMLFNSYIVKQHAGLLCRWSDRYAAGYPASLWLRKRQS